jgi:aminopeptidase YwaD
MNRLSLLLLALLTTVSLACGSVAVAAPERAALTEAVPDAAALTEVAPDAASLRQQPVAAPPVSPHTETAPTFSGASAYQYVDALSVGIGSRVAGSPAQTQTHDYLLARFGELGYQVELQSFTINAYQDRGSSMELIGAAPQSVPANTLQYSTGGTAEAVLVEAGLGRDNDFAAVDARGSIALVTRGETRFADKVEAAARAGAVGLIVVNNAPGNFNGSLVGLSSIPAVSVSETDGVGLRGAAARGERVRVTVDASAEPRTGSNVVATRPGGPETLVIGAHIDSVAAGPGANDNASGTAVMLELARVLAAAPTPYTLTFVGFDAEEIGLIGSGHYVSQLSEEQRQAIKAMINLDMVGVGTESRVGGTDALVRLAQSVGTRSGLSLTSMGEAGASDHASFTRAGIPALFIHRTNDPNYHSPNDKAEYIDPANLELSGQLALDVIAALERGE